MNAEGFITVQRIADDLADHPLLRDIPYDRIINYTQELIRITGSPKLFINKIETIHVDDYRALLPCDFISMVQVRGSKCEEYVYSMDTFLTKKCHCGDVCMGIKSYKVQGNVIFTSDEKCDIEVSYNAIPVDDDGFPMIPDNAKFIRALEAYIKYKRFGILFDQGRINQAVYANAQQDYDWCIGQAQTDFLMPDIDMMETLGHVWNNLIVRTTAHRNNFSTEHNREYLRVH